MMINQSINQSINNLKKNQKWQTQNRDLKVLSNQANKPDKIQMQRDFSDVWKIVKIIQQQTMMMIIIIIVWEMN